MPKNVLSTAIKLFFASLLVGLLMHWFDITPRSIVENFGETVQDTVRAVASFIRWSLYYVVLGAAVVVPVWLIVVAVGKAKGK